MIYLDNSATTEPYPEVIESFSQAAGSWFGNPSSVHQIGMKAEKLLRRARVETADLLGVEPEEVIFTSGGTESNNTAIKGIAFEHQQRGMHIITTQIEHPSVLETCKELEKYGFEVTYLPVDKKGLISLAELKDSIRKDTILISVMHVNNELGTIQPIKEIGEIASHHPRLFFHVDHVQGVGKVPLELKDSGIDFCTMSGHKIHGLKGTGILYVNRKIKAFSLLQGGGQEFSRRSGTENVAGAVSFAKALRIISELQATKDGYLATLQHHLIEKLTNLENVYINSPAGHAPHILNISVPGYKPEVIIHALAAKGVYISTKSACSSRLPDESAILAACGFGEERNTSALRISFSYQNTIEEVNTFCSLLNQSLTKLEGVMG